MFYLLALQELLVATMVALLWEVSDEHRMFVQSQAVKGPETVLGEAHGGLS